MNAPEPLTFHGKEVHSSRIATEGIYATAECRHGFMKWLAKDYGVGQLLALYGEYFEGEVALWQNLLRAGDTVVFAGGNIGVHVIPLSRIVGDLGHLHVFEPQVEIMQIMRENLAVNACTQNVTLYMQALGSSMGSAAISLVPSSVPNNFGGMHIVTEDEIARGIVSQDCEVVTIDSLNLSACHMIVLDVEGHEQEALRGAVDTIAKHRPYLYVEVDKEEKREPLLHYMRDELGYEVLFHLPHAFREDNFAGNPVNEYGDIRSIMCLGIARP